MHQSLRVFNLLFFIAMIVVNALGELLPLGIGSTGAISAKYPNLFTPAPLTFSIWGLIYLLLAAFIIYQLNMGGNSTTSTQLVAAIGGWFIFSCIMNIGWMISWHYDVIWLSLIFIICLLLSLLTISSSFCDLVSPNIITKVSCFGFNVYLGWICAATIANISVLMVKIGWNRFGFPEQLWTMVALIVGAILAVLFIVTRNNYAAAFAIIWAYCGILTKHISQSGHAGQYPVIIITAFACIAAILVIGILKLLLPKHS